MSDNGELGPAWHDHITKNGGRLTVFREKLLLAWLKYVVHMHTIVSQKLQVRAVDENTKVERS